MKKIQELDEKEFKHVIGGRGGVCSLPGVSCETASARVIKRCSRTRCK